MIAPRLTFVTSACGQFRARIAAGRIYWLALEAGQWVEIDADANLPESLKRQAEYVAAGHWTDAAALASTCPITANVPGY